ncbi:MAG: hypothetical protein J7K72_04450 [Candidatus Aenigmarchaeota archaeon]|nr:hypothetical protein [Candidatus Aenigmarchaeota archaeon]
MTSEDEHKKIIKELLDDLNEKIRNDLIVERQKIVGFTTSEISCNFLALLLHRKNLISPGFNVNHRFFISEKIARKKFDFDFPFKEKLIPLLVEQERYRILLCYGRDKKRDVVEKAIKVMLTIKKIIEEEIGETI